MYFQHGCSKLMMDVQNSKEQWQWPLDYTTYPRQQFLSKEAPTAVLAAKISGMKLNLASCRITTVISCCLDKIATKLCHNASKWSLKWPVNIVERRRIIPEFKLEENWAKIIGLFVRILAGDGGIISKLYILHLIWRRTQDFAFSNVSLASSNILEYFKESVFWFINCRTCQIYKLCQISSSWPPLFLPCMNIIDILPASKYLYLNSNLLH